MPIYEYMYVCMYLQQWKKTSILGLPLPLLNMNWYHQVVPCSDYKPKTRICREYCHIECAKKPYQSFSTVWTFELYKVNQRSSCSSLLQNMH
ncbi:hypothetical protein ACJMK2_009544 [Sinanodonta woodiana]|uniref:Uncharacterized protein n=1 Tax=Sinanodonta woodiana TaxID=1069815 RepID=A0ABD3VCJ7_SINWO